MIKYVVGHNPDDRIISQANEILKSGGLIAIPIDTHWVAVGDTFNQDSVKKIYQLRNIEAQKHLSILCLDFRMASSIAKIEDSAYSLIKKVVPGPYTFIFKATKNIQKSLKASKFDHEVGIRFPKSILLQKILIKFNSPLISSHLTLNMCSNADGVEEIYSALIEEEFFQSINLIIDTGLNEFEDPSSVISFCETEPKIIRVGSGDVKVFEK